MVLLCVAYLGEAQSFIKNLRLKNSAPDLYQNQNISLLITGEGVMNVLANLPYHLANLKPDKVINFGIAGILSELEIHEIYPIRTVYNTYLEEVEFHSFSPQNSHVLNLQDCISSVNRIKSNEKREELKHFAPLVDREAWGIAKACSEFKVPYEIYKLTSDFASEDTDCFSLKEKASEFSMQLYSFFESLNLNSTNISSEKFENTISSAYATQTQRRRIVSLLKKLSSKYQYSEEYYFQKFNNESRAYKSEKEKTQSYIRFLECCLNPIQNKLEEQFKQKLTSLTSYGIDVLYDKSFEKQGITLKMDVNSNTNLEKYSKALTEFDYKKLNNFWDGDINV